MSEVRTAVVGVGALGQHHARVFASLPGCRLGGVYDVDPRRAKEVADRHGAPVLERLRDVIGAADAVSVAVPTVDHHRVARALLEAGKDVLVEKPIATTLEEADDLIRVAGGRRAVLQIGHIERFNPATDVLRAATRDPRFIEVHRLGSFSARSLDIDVVLDLMIHDLDIVLALDGSEPLQVDAVGVPVLTPRVDIANVRLRFRSGLIANLTASRVSAEKVRKFRVFFPRTYISVDFAAQETQVYRLVAGPGGAPDIAVERTAAPGEEPLKRQLAAFLDAVRTRGAPVVSGLDGRRALALAQTILVRMNSTA
ncbi:MAG TPA: Gfo/Idh/MocA family oxidoreductase [Vicinamibacteria bacterium]|nr:Gfo/Idh/MocA family oxidoreductase [Vicinamibacteria bacterium]